MAETVQRVTSLGQKGLLSSLTCKDGKVTEKKKKYSLTKDADNILDVMLRSKIGKWYH